MTRICKHETCPARCHFSRLIGLEVPTDLAHYERERPLWAIEESGVRVGQRYRSWQRGSICRVVALGLSTTGDSQAMIAFEDEKTSVTYFMMLRDFTDHIAGHKRWELLP